MVICVSYLSSSCESLVMCPRHRACTRCHRQAYMYLYTYTFISIYTCVYNYIQQTLFLIVIPCAPAIISQKRDFPYIFFCWLPESTHGTLAGIVACSVCDYRFSLTMFTPPALDLFSSIAVEGRLKPFGGVGPLPARQSLIRQPVGWSSHAQGRVMNTIHGLMPYLCKPSAHLPPGSLLADRSVFTDIHDVAGNQVPNPAGHQGPIPVMFLDCT